MEARLCRLAHDRDAGGKTAQGSASSTRARRDKFALVEYVCGARRPFLVCSYFASRSPFRSLDRWALLFFQVKRVHSQEPRPDGLGSSARDARGERLMMAVGKFGLTAEGKVSDHRPSYQKSFPTVTFERVAVCTNDVSKIRNTRYGKVTLGQKYFL
jgi:hypothetical protein